MGLESLRSLNSPDELQHTAHNYLYPYTSTALSDRIPFPFCNSLRAAPHKCAKHETYAPRLATLTRCTEEIIAIALLYWLVYSTAPNYTGCTVNHMAQCRTKSVNTGGKKKKTSGQTYRPRQTVNQARHRTNCTATLLLLAVS